MTISIVLFSPKCHFLQFQEYRRCVEKWKVSAVNTLFDTLHAMCNLLILPPENLRGAAQGDQLANLDRTILDNWIQLRTDYKTLKLGSYLQLLFKIEIRNSISERIYICDHFLKVISLCRNEKDRKVGMGEGYFFFSFYVSF